MSYVSLYRKWRPRTFDDVRGQEAVVTTLKNQVITDRTGHAYIFIGSRGTGKTSVARVLAAALNCDKLQDGNPCCECESCKSIMSGASMNVREIDAASNNGVDSVRELNEDVVFPPVSGRKKVYIIDEVHMLSSGAFNALLKTLEEPPEYVTFILATTETAKIPLTIFSRCQRYDFHRIPVAEIEAQVRHLCEEEGLDIEDKACNYIAKKADGAMRDALSLLDRCSSYAMGERITYDKVLSAIGAVDTDIFSRMFRSLIACDTVGCIECLDEAITEGGVISTFITDLIGYLRDLLLLSASVEQDISDLLELTEENFARMKEERELTDPATLTMYIRSLSSLLSDLKYTNQQRTLAEVAFIKLTRPAIDGSEPDAATVLRIQALEKKLSEVTDELERVKAEGVPAFAPGAVAAPTGTETGTDVVTMSPKGGGESPGGQSHLQDRHTSYEELPDSMKKFVGIWNDILSMFETPSLLPTTLGSAKIAIIDGHTLEIMVESQRCFENMYDDSKNGNGRTNIEELKVFISESTGIDIPIEVTKIEKGKMGDVCAINELVHMDIEPDERKDDV